MTAAWKVSLGGVMGAILVVAFMAGILWNQPAQGNNLQADKATVCPRYTVVHTEGTNLIITDNQTNTLYFYTIEEDGKPGDDLILRGKGDLNQVGKDVIKPTLVNPKKKPN